MLSAPGSVQDKHMLASRLVDGWFATTRDNYLAILVRFADFMRCRGVALDPPFHFKVEHLLAFVDLLLSRPPTGKGQLRVSTV